MKRDCSNCGNTINDTCNYGEPCGSNNSGWIPIVEKVTSKTISFPILNNLTPTLESCTKKVFEEIGELMQLLGKGQRQSGELIEQMNNKYEWRRRVVEEALDGAQALVTLIDTLLDEPGDMEIAMERHIEKLKGKGYLKC